MVSVVLGFFWPLLARVKHEEINENTPPQSGALQEEDFQRFPGKDKIIQVANHNHKQIYLISKLLYNTELWIRQGSKP